MTHQRWGDPDRFLDDGFCLIDRAVDQALVQELRQVCDRAFLQSTDEIQVRSSKGHVYAARNLIDSLPHVQIFWKTGILHDFLCFYLGREYGLVRVLFFDKPPDRSWGLPWHKDTAIAVQDNSLPSNLFTRPTRKAGVPHVIAPDSILQRMLTLRVHLDDVTTDNGALKVIPGSHQSSTSDGVGVDLAESIYCNAGDVLAMRPLISHSSGASRVGTQQHRRILHLEFAADRHLADGYRWHDFISASS